MAVSPACDIWVSIAASKQKLNKVFNLTALNDNLIRKQSSDQQETRAAQALDRELSGLQRGKPRILSVCGCFVSIFDERLCKRVASPALEDFMSCMVPVRTARHVQAQEAKLLITMLHRTMDQLTNEERAVTAAAGFK